MKRPRLSERLESVGGDAQAADAEFLFLLAIQHSQLGLPRAAFEELSALKREEIPEWAKRWSVHAPCVLNAAEAWCDGGLEVAEELWFTVHRGAAVPSDWRSEMDVLNQLPVEFTWLDDVLAKVISESERQKQLIRLRRKPETPETPEIEIARALGERYLTIAWPQIRASQLQQDAVLAPIAADPLRESREAFLTRAGNHWDGRANRAIARGYSATSRKPELETHVGWLVWNRVRRKSTKKIANAVNATRQTVEEAINTVAKLIQLAPPPRRRKLG